MPHVHHLQVAQQALATGKAGLHPGQHLSKQVEEEEEESPLAPCLLPSEPHEHPHHLHYLQPTSTNQNVQLEGQVHISPSPKA